MAVDVLMFENISHVLQYHQLHLETFPNLFYSQLNYILFPIKNKTKELFEILCDIM